ncbi:MAG: plasmid mobilization protein [Lachnospiraceae bacterium]
MTAPNRNRNNIVYIRLNDEEYDSFEKQREKTGLNKTDFLIQLIESREIKVFNINPELHEIIHELKKQGVNLNQIARALNQNPYSPTNTSLTYLQTEYRQLSDQILTLISKVNAL